MAVIGLRMVQCNSTGDQENACDLDQRWYLIQDQDPNHGGKGS